MYQTKWQGRKLKEITPVLLAGGSGTRLWPASRKSYPKQFSLLFDDKTLFQKSALRLMSCDELTFAKHVTVTHSDYRFIVDEQLKEIGIDTGSILLEPEGKNTAPAILAATLHILEDSPDATLLVAPSDHIIPDTEAFHLAIKKGLTETEKGKIILFGITPTRAETGYGYLELIEKPSDDPTKLKSFIEKPDKVRAELLSKDDRFLWNSGFFLCRAKDLIKGFEIHLHEILEPVKRSLEKGSLDLGFLRLEPKSWHKCSSISIDYALMEKLDNLMAVPFSASWSDLGDWEALSRHMIPDANGVSSSKNSTSINCQDTLLHSENADQQLVGIGLKDIVAVAMPDAVLVSHKNQAQNINKAVTLLKGKGILQAESFRKDHRPWGWFEILALGNRFQVKLILVNPECSLSLQSHRHRSEHWTVVEGTAKVTVNKENRMVSEGESIYIPLGAHHRLENPGKSPIKVIEVQTGDYLGEDDIVRYEDNYARI